jgi:YVTN family beta-propeller protein
LVPISVGSFPDGVASGPDGTSAYVTNQGSSTVSVSGTATATSTVTAAAGTGSRLVGIAVFTPRR